MLFASRAFTLKVVWNRACGVAGDAQSALTAMIHTPTRRPVVNDTGRDVFDVWVTAEGLNPSKKVLTTGITFVGPMIGRSKSAPFEAKIPAVEGIETFRVTVTSYRAGTAIPQGRETQSP